MLSTMHTVEFWSVYDFPFTKGKMRLIKFKTHVKGPQLESNTVSILNDVGKAHTSSQIKFG